LSSYADRDNAPTPNKFRITWGILRYLWLGEIGTDQTNVSIATKSGAVFDALIYMWAGGGGGGMEEDGHRRQ
jgi:hypothetical protein